MAVHRIPVNKAARRNLLPKLEKPKLQVVPKAKQKAKLRARQKARLKARSRAKLKAAQNIMY